MLNMLPKLALVVIEMYFRVFAKVGLQSSMPLRRMSRSLLEQDEIGSIPGDIHGAIHRNAHVGSIEGWCIVDAIAHVSDDCPVLCRRG